MARVKRGVMRHKRHKKIIKKATGYFGRKKNVFKHAHEQVMKSGQYAFRDRRVRKREFRKLWVVRLTAACEACGEKYNRFIHALTQKGIAINRKMLSELAIHDMDAFKLVLKEAIG